MQKSNTGLDFLCDDLVTYVIQSFAEIFSSVPHIEGLLHAPFPCKKKHNVYIDCLLDFLCATNLN